MVVDRMTSERQTSTSRKARNRSEGSNTTGAELQHTHTHTHSKASLQQLLSCSRNRLWLITITRMKIKNVFKHERDLIFFFFFTLLLVGPSLGFSHRSRSLTVWATDIIIISLEPTLFTSGRVGLETFSDSLTKMFGNRFWPQEQAVIPRCLPAAPGHFRLSAEADRNTPPNTQKKGTVTGEVSWRTFLTAPRGCYHWNWLHFLVQKCDTGLVGV